MKNIINASCFMIIIQMIILIKSINISEIDSKTVLKIHDEESYKDNIITLTE